MYRIDDLITEIHADEVIDIPNELTREQISSIEKRIIYKKKIIPHRKRNIFILVAAIVLSLGLTAFATKQNEWDLTLIQFMGLNDAKTLQLDGGEVVIDIEETNVWTDYKENQKGEQKKYSITGITSIGDRNSAYLKVSTDYELPEEFDETTDYILPENNKIDITYKNVFGHSEIRTFASAFMACYENGKLGFLISIENCKELNKCDVSLEIENLYWYHDLGKSEDTKQYKAEELLAEGVWNVQWRYSYKSNVITKRLWKQFRTKEGEVYLSKIEISPISIRMEAIRNPKDREKSWTQELLEEIEYADGTKIKVDSTGAGGIGNGVFIEEFTNVYYWGEPLVPENVKCLKVCGQNIDI